MRNEIHYSFDIEFDKRIKTDQYDNIKIFDQTKRELDKLNKIRKTTPIVACLKTRFGVDYSYDFNKEHWILIDDSFNIDQDSGFYFRVAEREEYIILTMSNYLNYKDAGDRCKVYKRYRGVDENWYLEENPQWDFEKFDYRVEFIMKQK